MAKKLPRSLLEEINSCLGIEQQNSVGHQILGILPAEDGDFNRVNPFLAYLKWKIENKN